MLLHHVVAAALVGMLVAASAQDSRDDAIALAKVSLARELNVPVERIDVVDATPTTWRDSSLGCPAAGMVYTQALVPGYNVTLSVGAVRHSAHVGAGRAAICGLPPAVVGRDLKVSPGDPALGLKLAERARTDLASRLKVAADQVAIDVFRQTIWPDESLGCPETGRTYTTRQTRGYTIVLEHAAKTYEYHSDLSRVIFCQK